MTFSGDMFLEFRIFFGFHLALDVQEQQTGTNLNKTKRQSSGAQQLNRNMQCYIYTQAKIIF